MLLARAAPPLAMKPDNWGRTNVSMHPTYMKPMAAFRQNGVLWFTIVINFEYDYILLLERERSNMQ